MQRINKSCDQCKIRKVRCIVASDESSKSSPSCIHCLKRGEECRYSVFRQRRPRPLAAAGIHPGESDGLLIDQILLNDSPDLDFEEDGCQFAPNNRVPSSCLSFFSDKRLASLSSKLGTGRLQSLVEQLADFINACHNAAEMSSYIRASLGKSDVDIMVTEEEHHQYIESYFDNVHPIHPFLDRQSFEKLCSSPHLQQLLTSNAPFSALYHAVLASGCQHCGGGSYRPGSGRAWQLFQVSLGCISELILQYRSLVALQAVTAMAVFSSNTTCLVMDGRLVSQAAQMAQFLRFHQTSNRDAIHLRTFWIVYKLEQCKSFEICQASLLADEDIGCMVPDTPASKFGDYDWFLSSIRAARLRSVAYSSLFSVSASLQPIEALLKAVENVRSRLETWRTSIPVDFRPNEPIDPAKMTTSCHIMVALETHWSYYELSISLERISLHLAHKRGEAAPESQLKAVEAARSIIRLTPFIPMAPHVPMHIGAAMPLAAVFILFDFVIDNPKHETTQLNLEMLELGVSYFSRFEEASDGVLPGCLAKEFSDLANDYVAKIMSPSPTDDDMVNNNENSSEYASTQSTAELGSDSGSYFQTLLGRKLAERSKQPTASASSDMFAGTVAPVMGFGSDGDQQQWDANMFPINNLNPFESQLFRSFMVPTEPGEAEPHLLSGGMVFPEWGN